VKQLLSALKLAGVDVRRSLATLRGLPGYWRSFRQFKQQANGFAFGKPYPCFGDDQPAPLDYYFWQDLWVARRVFKNAPQRHVDVGSRIDGFVAHVATFREVEVLDLRRLPDAIPNVTFTQADLQQPLPEALRDYTDSLSCLHALEHFGLGRYGDELDAEGHLKGWRNLVHLLQPNGKLYFSVPIGPQRIEFNAHRVFSVEFLLDLFGPNFRVTAFAYVDDGGRFNETDLTPRLISTNLHCRFGCGIFELKKLS